MNIPAQNDKARSNSTQNRRQIQLKKKKEKITISQHLRNQTTIRQIIIQLGVIHSFSYPLFLWRGPPGSNPI